LEHGQTEVLVSGLGHPEGPYVLPDGRIVFWGSFSPATGKGQILAFDTQCRLLGAIDLETGKPPVRPEETIEIFAFMEAADESARQGGAPVPLAAVLATAKTEAAGKLRLHEP